MRIHSIELTHVRGIEHLKIDDIPDNGVVVISGPNEAGKSTILEALEVLQKERHDSKSKKKVLCLQPIGKDVPVTISMRATLGPVTFSITKQYVRQRFAELNIEAPKREHFTGREADDAFANLLAEHLDSALADALFVRQGDIDATIAAAGIPSLGRALEEAGGAEATVDDTALVQRVEKEYLRYFTATGKPSRELAEARLRHSEATNALEQAQRDVSALDGDVSAVERLTHTQSDLNGQLPQAELDEKTRRSELDQALLTQSQLQAAETEVKHRKLLLESAQKKVTERELLNAEITELTAKISAATQEQEQLASEAEHETELLAAAREEATKLEKVLDEERVNLEEARKTHSLAIAAAEHKERALLINDLDGRDQELAKLRAAIPETTISKDQISAIEDADLAVRVAQARLTDSAANLRLESSQSIPVLIEGENIEIGPDPHTVLLTKRTELKIGEITATFVPASSSDDLNLAVAQATETLARQLAQIGATDLANARQLYEVQEQAVRTVASKIAQKSALLAGKDEAQLRYDHADLTRRLADRELPTCTIEEAQAIVAELSDAVQSLAQQLQIARTEVQNLGENSKTQQARDHEIYLQVLVERLKALKERAEAWEAEQALSEVIEGVVRAESELALASKALGNLQASSPDVRLAQGLYDNALQKLRGIQEQLHEGKVRIAELRAKIEYAEGTAQRLIEAQQAHESATFQLERVQAQAEAAELLRSTLIKHRDFARERYAAPFAEKLTALGRTVFGASVEFGLGDDLRIEQRILDGTAVESLALSGGATEQLGLLARFAIAELTAQDGGVPIFVDDALGNTDARRLELMNYLFSHLGKQHQVFVLTCMPSRFDAIAGRVSLRMEDLTAGT